ncbi:MAG: phytanoyl-CoA dioxygenase family protein [Phycisphaeraceae bacterium]
MLLTVDHEAGISEADVAFYHREGYLIARGLYSSAEVQRIKAFFDGIGDKGQPIPGHWNPAPNDGQAGEVLQRFPRVMHPHRFDPMSKAMMLHPRVGQALELLLGESAVAAQSMFYFKPPGAKGQALHQDNFYLEVAPGSCLAAWTAIDRSVPENGGMYIVPRSHTLDIQCPEKADDGMSFTTHLVNAPKGFKAIPAEMEPGDTLFFNGSVIHGSGPNRSTSEWRRAFICHYMPKSSRQISKGYHPLHDFAGNQVPYQASTGGGPCGMEVKPGSYDQVH